MMLREIFSLTVSLFHFAVSLLWLIAALALFLFIAWARAGALFGD